MGADPVRKARQSKPATKAEDKKTEFRKPDGKASHAEITAHNQEVINMKEKQTQMQEDAAHADMLKSVHSQDLKATLVAALRESQGVDRKQTGIRQELVLALNKWVLAERERQTTITLVLSKIDMQNICYELAGYDKRNTLENGDHNPTKSPSFEMNVNRAIEAVLVLHKVKDASIDDNGNVCVPNNMLVPQIRQKVHGKLIDTPNPSSELTVAPVAWITDIFAKQFGRPTRGTKKRAEAEAAAGMVDLDKAMNTIYHRIRDINKRQDGKTLTPEQYVMLAKIVYEGDLLLSASLSNDILLNRILFVEKDKDNVASVISDTKEKASAAYLNKHDDEDEIQDARVVA